MHLLNLDKLLGTSTLPLGVSTPPKLFENVPMCLRNLQNIGVCNTMRSEHDSISEVPTPDPIGV